MGTVLAVSTSTGAVTIGKVRGIDGPESDAPPIDITTIDSTGRFRVFSGAGAIDGGEVTLDVVYYTSESGMTRLVDYHYNGTEKNYTLTYNTTGTDTQEFAAIVPRIGQSIPLDDVVTRSITLKISKTPAWST
jgi:hypothetical protein